MLVIHNQQLDVFRSLALERFEDEMVEHVKTFFPNHFFTMQESGVRGTIRYAYWKAVSYGFSTKRNVCLYLNVMLVLGSNFDYDPQYPWAQAILNDQVDPHPVIRIDKLADTTLEVFYRISGRRHLYLNRALHHLHTHAAQVFDLLRAGTPTNAMPRLEMLFPERYQVVGEPALQRMIRYGLDQAPLYGLTTAPNQFMYVVFMFMLGSGFDRDPQYTWASEILTDLTLSNQNEKTEMLYRRAMAMLGRFLAQYKH